MTLIKRNSNELWPSLFEDILGKDIFTVTPQKSNSYPAINIKEDEQGYSLELAVPGMTKKDFNIEVDNDELIISYERKEEKKEEANNYTRKEFALQSFRRRFALPETADQAGIKANYQDGILSLIIPKKEEAKKKEPRLIKVG